MNNLSNEHIIALHKRCQTFSRHCPQQQLRVSKCCQNFHFGWTVSLRSNGMNTDFWRLVVFYLLGRSSTIDKLRSYRLQGVSLISLAGFSPGLLKWGHSALRNTTQKNTFITMQLHHLSNTHTRLKQHMWANHVTLATSYTNTHRSNHYCEKIP